MQLIFEGHSTIERGFDGVKFVGCCRETHEHDRYVPCRVTRDALEFLSTCKLDDSSQSLLNAYQANSEIINRIASAQFSGGVDRPLVNAQDVTQFGRNAA